MEEVPIGARIQLKKYDNQIGILLASNISENCFILAVGEKFERWIMKYNPEEATLVLVMNMNRPGKKETPVDASTS